jgi:hypothetical protein
MHKSFFWSDPLTVYIFCFDIFPEKGVLSAKSSHPRWGLSKGISR